MSEHWPEFGSDPSNVEPEATGSSSANGAHPEDAVGVAERPADDPVAAESGTADESPATAESIDVGAVSEDANDTDATAAQGEPEAADQPAAVADDAVAATASSDDGAAVASTADGEFLAELARAMQATAAIQRVKIVEDAERRRQEHVELVRAREAAEADRMRELAAEDMKAIESWADGERKRIQLERHRRSTELHEDLDLSLAEHRSKIDREIEGVEKAIAAYRAEVDSFFDGLDRETDVVVIAQHAAWRPVFPTLDLIGEPVTVAPADTAAADQSTTDEPPSGSDDHGATGARSGDSEPAVVGVMDPQAPAEPAESWTATPETSPEAVPAEASGDAGQGEAHESVEPVATTAGANHSAVSSLFESVQVLRPMAWLRREANGGDRSNH